MAHGDHATSRIDDERLRRSRPRRCWRWRASTVRLHQVRRSCCTTAWIVRGRGNGVRVVRAGPAIADAAHVRRGAPGRHVGAAAAEAVARRGRTTFQTRSDVRLSPHSGPDRARSYIERNPFTRTTGTTRPASHWSGRGDGGSDDGVCDLRFQISDLRFGDFAVWTAQSL